MAAGAAGAAVDNGVADVQLLHQEILKLRCKVLEGVRCSVISLSHFTGSVSNSFAATTKSRCM